VHDVPLAAPRNHRRELERAFFAGRQSETDFRTEHAVIADLVAFAARLQPFGAGFRDVDAGERGARSVFPERPVVLGDVSIEGGEKSAFVVAVGIFDGFDLPVTDEREECGVSWRRIAAQDGAGDELDLVSERC
jgi:hypothetical protein